MIWAEILEDNEEFFAVHFKYDPVIKERIKRCAGSRFVGKDKGGPYWRFPLDLSVCRILRSEFGKEFKVGPKLHSWGLEAIKRDRELEKLSSGRTAKLVRLQKVLPELYKAIHLGPIAIKWAQDLASGVITPEAYQSMRDKALAGPASFQAADVAFGAATKCFLNGNHPGIGKTIETIASIFEAGMEEGRHLIICPVSSKDTVWRYELERWQPYPVWVVEGGAKTRERIIDDFFDQTEAGPGWLVINSEMVRAKNPNPFSDDFQIDAKVQKELAYPILGKVRWNTIVRDEIHKQGTRNISSQTNQGMKLLKGDMRIALSGTPLGGKVINLFPVLQWLRPDLYTSKWKWADQWLQVTTQRGRNYVAREVGDIRPEVKEAFFKSLNSIMIRRTKDEVLSWLPPKQRINLWCGFGSKEHEAQYRSMEEHAMAEIEGGNIIANGVLAEYTRLKQIAGSLHGEGFRPTQISGKILALAQILEERGILNSEEGNGWEGEQVVIFSQFSSVVKMIAGWLGDHRVPHAVITGETNRKGERAQIQQEFQAGKIRVLVMTTTSGGVSITLDRASTAVIFDETWVPDDQEQAEDRVHRASRIHQVTCYYLRTQRTVEEDIMEIGQEKQDINDLVLDLRRKMTARTKQK